jgi:hypothetical protein
MAMENFADGNDLQFNAEFIINGCYHCDIL